MLIYIFYCIFWDIFLTFTCKHGIITSMKYIAIFLLTFFYVNAMTLTLNSAKQSGLPYATIHLKNDEPILCESKDRAYGLKLYLCMFDGNLKNKIQNKKTPYVDIEFSSEGEKFFIYIKPKAFSQMINTDAKLYDSPTTPLKNNKNAKHWTILIYKKKPFSEKENYEGINFPITYPDFQYPSVGALDLNDKPIDYAKTNDINLYLDIKKYYDRKNYNDVLDVVDRLIKKYPHSIFMSDVLLYRLRSLDKMLDIDDEFNQMKIDRTDIISEAKKWLKTFPTDKNTPEVLAIISKSYLDVGFKTEANYFLDMLVSEYPDDKYTQRAVLNYADYLHKGKNKKEAIKLYEDVLYSSKDLDVASEAAIRLAKNSLKKGQKQKAKDYLDKILKANEDFIFGDKNEAYALAQTLAKEGLYKSAATIINTLMKDTKRIDPSYEMKLKDAGIWNEKAKNITTAYEYLKSYQKQFAYGDYKELVQQALDRLFFELNETNATKLAKYYDELIKRYKNEIGTKALISKAKLLLKQKKYNAVLALEDELLKNKNDTQALDILNDAAFFAITNALKNDKCVNAVNIENNHEKAVQRVEDKVKLFSCFLRTGRYEKAKNLALSYMNNKNLVVKLVWMLRLEKVLFAQGEYAQTIKIAKDIEALGEMLKNEKANEALYDRFFALAKLSDYANALQIADKISKLMPDNFKNVEVYGKVVKLAKSQENDLIVTTYAKKALDLEKKVNSYILSPQLEYDFITSLQKINKNKEAKDVALSILKRDLDKSQRGRALYVIAESYAKLNDNKNAKDYFTKCVKFDENSSWGGICSENLNLFDNNETNETNEKLKTKN